MRDYLNPARIYTDGLYDVGVSNLESTTDNENVIGSTVKDFLTTAEDCSGDEVVYSTPICSGKCCAAAPVRENLTTENAESAKMSRERAANVLERRIPEFEGLLHFRIGEYEQIVRDTIIAIHVAIRALREGV